MEKLFERHDAYLSDVPMGYVRDFINDVDWDARLIAIKGPKGVGKSTLIQQYIKQHFDANDRHVLYCSADTNYFSTNTIVDVAERFAKIGGKYLFIDEIHKYKGWSREIKDIYDLRRDMHIVISGSSLIQINDGQADLSRRLLEYDMPGLSFREFLKLDQNIDAPSVTLPELLAAPNTFCKQVKQVCRPLEHFKNYLQLGYYPFFMEGKKAYYTRVENVINYIIDVELTKFRNLEIGYTRNLKALLHVISEMTPYEFDIAKLSRAIGVTRPTTLKYLRNLEEANLIIRLFADLNSVSDLQKPDKIYLDNPNLLYTLCTKQPEIGTVRETFFANQLKNAKHRVEYAGFKRSDFRIDGDTVIEVEGADKGSKQIAGQENAFIAADDIESAVMRKIPLWAFGFLY